MRHVAALFLSLVLTATAMAVNVNIAFEATAIQIAAAQRETARVNVGVQEYNDDIIANQARIDARNVQITAENVERAAMDPPLDPLPLLEDDPREARTPYTAQTLMIERILRQCDRWVQEQGRQDRDEMRLEQLWNSATDETKAAVRQLLIDGA